MLLLYGCYFHSLPLPTCLHSLNSLCIPELSLVCHFQQVTVHLLILFI
jgi:hypothetical protein